MKVWDIVKQVTIYVGEDELHPTASCQVFIYGTRGYMYSIIGRNFLIALPLMQDIFKKYNIKTLEGPMTPIVAAAVKKRLEDAELAKVTISEPEDFGNGINLPYVLVEIL